MAPPARHLPAVLLAVGINKRAYTRLDMGFNVHGVRLVVGLRGSIRGTRLLAEGLIGPGTATGFDVGFNGHGVVFRFEREV